MKPYIVILTGPSCAGKSFLEAALKRLGFAAAISTTTRAPRAGEEDGKNYYFTTTEGFAALEANNEFVECVEFGGNRYGLTRFEAERVAATGASLVVVVEPNGRDQIIAFCKKHGWAYHAVYVGNPDEVITERFMKRLYRDLDDALDDDHPKIISDAARRMKAMMTVERGWIAEAYCQVSAKVEFPYDRLLWTFDENNSNEVILSLIMGARAHQRENGVTTPQTL